MSKELFVEMRQVALRIQGEMVAAICRLLVEPVTSSTEMGLCAFIRGLAGLHETRGDFLQYDECDAATEQVYALRPWEKGHWNGLFLREAFFELAKNTTLHPPSFECLLYLIVRSEEEVRQAKEERGSIAAPQEEELLRRTIKEAAEYLRYTSYRELTGNDRRREVFRKILDRWRQYPSKSIQKIIPGIFQDFFAE